MSPQINCHLPSVPVCFSKIRGNICFCPICHEPLVPRCGSKKINHWAHKKSTHCDKWWESETEWHLPKDWLNSSQPVLFDFKEDKNDIHDHMREPLWCLLPIHSHNNIRLLYEFDRNKFVYMVSNGYFEFDYTNIINKLRDRL